MSLLLFVLVNQQNVSNNRLQRSLHRCFQLEHQATQSHPTKQSVARWIWSNAQAESSAGEELTFQKTFSLSEPVAAAHIVASTDNGGDIFLNGEKVTSCKDWMYPVSEPVKVPFNEGTNTIRVTLKNIGGPAALKVMSPRTT